MPANTDLRATKFDVAHYHHENMPLMVMQINVPKILVRDICNNHAISLVTLFHGYVFDHARGTLSAATTATGNCSAA